MPFLPQAEVIFEGDSKLVIDAISSGEQQSHWRIRSLIVDIVKFCCDHCGWSFKHVKRQANSVAHNLAKWALEENLSGTIPTAIIPDSIFTSDNLKAFALSLAWFTEVYLEKNKK